MAKLLLIENDEEVVKLYQHFLGRRGWKVVSGLPKDMPAMVELVRQNEDVDIIVLDVPPELTIEEAVETVRREAPKKQLVLETSDGNILSVRVRKVPNVSALSKPYHMEEMHELLDVLTCSDWKKEVEQNNAEEVSRAH